VDDLIAAGMEPRERAGKRALYATVLERFAACGSGAPPSVWWVPGRLEVFGKHTDYAGGRTLVSAVPRGFAVAAAPRRDALVRIVDAKRGEELIADLTCAPAVHDGWRRYADVTVRRMARNFPGLCLGADIVIASDLPSASGMSSSSALIIAVAVALGRLGQIDDHPAWRANIRTRLDAAGYYACIENGRRFGTLDGDGGVGTHGGSEDHTAIVDGRPGHVSAYAFVPPRSIGSARMPDAWRLVIAPSGVAARKTGEAKIPYNRLSAGVSRLLDVWNSQIDGDRTDVGTSRNKAASLAEALRSDPHGYERLRDLCARAAAGEMPAAWLRDRLDHFVREDGRIDAALAAFAAADGATLGELAADSQQDAEALLRNQVPATSALAAEARRLGALAACSFGAGFGGAVWALVPAFDAEAFAIRWSTGSFVMMPGPAVIELSAG
jgi:galactokinase